MSEHDKKPDHSYRTFSFVIRNIHFEYTDKLLAFDLCLKEPCESIENMHHESILLKRKYTEETYNFWDVLMGI
jgi:hypothetical protein